MTKPYWYKFTICECPLCGKTTSFKQRMYTPKPELDADRYKYLQEYDYCMEC